jgi:hypothetical protein
MNEQPYPCHECGRPVVRVVMAWGGVYLPHLDTGCDDCNPNPPTGYDPSELYKQFTKVEG